MGTRPEIVKVAPILCELNRRGIRHTFVHTGQHYDYEMSRVFIDQLGVGKPDYSFELKNSKPAAQIAEIMLKLERNLPHHNYDLLLIQGDTNSMLAAALTGVKMGFKVGHVEAGLRSFDWRMPEEHNRRMVDHISDLLFAPTEESRANLAIEQVHGRISVTGNTVIDAVLRFIPTAERISRVSQLLKFSDFVLVTLHRMENVTDTHTLRQIVQALKSSPLPIVFPMHPRTRNRLRELGLLSSLRFAKNVQLLQPQGYFDFLILMKHATLILTDSGGIQEEATCPAIRKPVLVLRKSTERPEAIRARFARLVNLESSEILREIRQILKSPPRLPSKSPYGDGTASIKIVDILSRG